MPNKEDKKLVRLAQKNRQAFDRLYDKYKLRVFNYFWYRLGYDDELAHDLTHDVFIKAFNSISRYQSRGYSYLTYLLRIAHNLLVNYLRDRQRQDFKLKSLPEVVAEDIEEALDNSISLERLWGEVGKLSLFEKEVILLRYRQEMSITEIAKVLNKTENSVKIILSRARQKLKHKFELKAIGYLPEIKSEMPAPSIQK